METITQLGPDAEAAPLARTFVESLRFISAQRRAEIARLQADRNSYRELALTAIAQLAELNAKLDAERASRLSLSAEYRALRGHTIPRNERPAA